MINEQTRTDGAMSLVRPSCRPPTGCGSPPPPRRLLQTKCHEPGEAGAGELAPTPRSAGGFLENRSVLIRGTTPPVWLLIERDRSNYDVVWESPLRGLSVESAARPLHCVSLAVVALTEPEANRPGVASRSV